jgi:hypothetical protein
VLFSADAGLAIRDGRLTETYRRWKRPQAVVGGRYRTPGGFVIVDDVQTVDPSEVPPDVVLHGDPTVPITRVRFHLDPDGTDARARLAEDVDVDVADIDRRLDRLDAASPHGPWTRDTLLLIAERPSTRAAELAAALGRQRDDWKRDVRKLKALGLTLSLERGYRLSSRGAAYLAARRREA